MNSVSKKREFRPNDHLSPELIKWYVAGQLSGKEMHSVEKHCLDCAFCSDALDGYASLGEAPAIENILAELNGAVEKRVNNTPTKVIPLGWKTWGVAASVAAIFIYSLFFFKQNVDKATENESIALQPSTAADSIGPSDKFADNPSLAPDTTSAQALALNEPSSPASAPAESAIEEQNPALEPAREMDKQSELPLQSKETTSWYADRNEAGSPIPPQVSHTLDNSSKQKAKITDQEDVFDSRNRVAAAKPSAGISPSATLGFIAPTVSGKVISSEDGSALPGLSVTVKGTNQRTTTDSEGNYRINAPAGSTLEFNFIGMVPKEIPVNAQRTPVDVAMEPDLQALSEVVVVGYGSQKLDSLKEEKVYTVETQPVNGFNEYKTYLSGNLRYPVEARQKGIAGSVTVEFFVEPDGTLTNFKILKSPGFGCDDEAIRLIKEGPRWKPGQKGNNPIRQRVKVKVKCRS